MSKPDTTARSIQIPEWAVFLKVELYVDIWWATIHGDPRGTGKLETVYVCGDTPADAVNNATAKAESHAPSTWEEAKKRHDRP